MHLHCQVLCQEQVTGGNVSVDDGELANGFQPRGGLEAKTRQLIERQTSA